MHIILFYISIALFFFSLYLYKFSQNNKLTRATYTVAAFLFLVLYLFYYISNYFTGSGINSATVYYIKFGLAGADFKEYWRLIVLSLIYLSGAGFLILWLNSKKQVKILYKDKKKHFSVLLIVFAFVASPILPDLYGLFSYIFKNTAAQESDFIKYYRQPIIEAAGIKQKNLVFIYAEGLEYTYFDENLFPGLINKLRALEKRSVSFTDIRQAAGAEATISGMVASQCGLPLFAPSGEQNKNPETVGFLSRADCFSDLLHGQGYYQVYYGGVSANFSGKRNFLSTHKFDEIYGQAELTQGEQGKQSGREWRWGLYDDTLLDLAYQRFNDLATTKEHFALYLLTLDTHHPDGHPSGSCKDIKYEGGGNPVLNAVACTDFLLGEFIERIMRSPYAQNTVITVASDHLAHNNSAYPILNKGVRRNLFMVASPGTNEPKVISKTGSALDIGITLLPFLGYSGTIALGRNLMDENQPVNEILDIQSKLISWHRSLSRFWGFPVIEQTVEVDVDNRIVIIDGIKFDLPALIELNDGLETNIIYGRSGLSKHMLAMPDNIPYILVDRNRHENGKYNLIIGRSGGNLNKYTIDGTYSISDDEIRYLTGISPKFDFDAKRVAHAGGGIGGVMHPNTLNALDYNIGKNYDFFEIDFSFTGDDRLVCLHDWQNGFASTFGYKPDNIPSLETFMKLVEKSEFKNCTLDSLAAWMEKNRSAYLITDVKGDNLKALARVAEKLPDSYRRVIPQVYDPDNFDIIKDMGFEQIIWTLYRYPKKNDIEQVLEWVDKFKGLFAVTMPQTQAQTMLPVELMKKGIPSYVHTVNDPKDMVKYISELGVTEIYTDFLIP